MSPDLSRAVTAGLRAAAFEGLDAEQMRIAGLVRIEAERQGVPVELALCTAELESMFKNVKAQNGASYGPMQVHTSALEQGETVGDLQNMAFSIARGIKILKLRLSQAGGDSELCRVMYFCGRAWEKSCTAPSLERLRARWRPAASKWGVKARYS